MTAQSASASPGDPDPAPRRRSRARRLPPSGNTRFDFDLGLCAGGTVAGADEAGRGSLAGPLVAAAVCLDYAQLSQADFTAMADLDDSKKLSRSARALLYNEILRRACQVTVICCSPHTIDRNGLHRCNLAALATALTAIAPAANVALVDGFKLPEGAPPHQAVIGGDGRSAAIAAASIVAKVARDGMMAELDARYPGYGFAQHKGYGTEEHLAQLRALGPCPEHRMSFAPVREVFQQRLPFGEREACAPTPVGRTCGVE